LSASAATATVTVAVSVVAASTVEQKHDDDYPDNPFATAIIITKEHINKLLSDFCDLY
jgi:hypothetical protein